MESPPCVCLFSGSLGQMIRLPEHADCGHGGAILMVLFLSCIIGVFARPLSLYHQSKKAFAPASTCL
jgi:hypothetical protein